MGAEIVNLSAESRLTSLRKVALADFLAARAPRRRVLHITRTNCAGAVWKLHQLMAKDARVESRVASASPVTMGIRRPRRFPQDISWRDSAVMRAAIARADILHFHNFVDAQSPCLGAFAGAMRGKPAVLQVHTEPALLAAQFPGRDPRSRSDIPVLVVAQKHARFYLDATPVLNALDPDEFSGQPGANRPAPGPPRVAFTPTDFADYPQVPPTCWGKSNRRTREILERLSAAEADLAGLAGDCVIGVNAAVLLRERLGCPFDYYCVSDCRFLAAAEGPDMVAAARPATRVFASYCDGLIPGEDIYYVRILNGDGASDDIRAGFHHGCSVFLFAAQVAACLEVDEVRLHGMECDYDAGRFFGSATGAPRRNDLGNYPRVARSAAALLARRRRRCGAARRGVIRPGRGYPGFQP